MKDKKEILKELMHTYFVHKLEFETAKEGLDSIKQQIKVVMDNEEYIDVEEVGRIRFKEQIRTGYDNTKMKNRLIELGENMKLYEKITNMKPLYIESVADIARKQQFVGQKA